MKNLMNFLSSIAAAISSIFGWALARSGLKNAPDVRAAEKAREEAKANDATAKAILKKDVDEIRKQLAE